MNDAAPSGVLPAQAVRTTRAVAARSSFQADGPRPAAAVTAAPPAAAPATAAFPASGTAAPTTSPRPTLLTAGQDAGRVSAACTSCNSTGGASKGRRGGKDRGTSACAGLDVGELGVAFSSKAAQPLLVEAVTPGSWADEVGFQPGDEVVEVNGSRALALSAEALGEALLERPLRIQLRFAGAHRSSVSRLTQGSDISWSSVGSSSSSLSSTTAGNGSRTSSHSLTDADEADGFASLPRRSSAALAAPAGLLDAAPEQLWVVAPPRPALQGEYRKSEGRLYHGEPEWQQVAGEGRLFSGSSGRWLMSENGAKVDKEVAQIKSADPHNGKSPHEISKWAFSGRDGSSNWVADMRGLIRVMRDQRAAEWCFMQQEKEAAKRAARAPAQLWVAAPPRPFLQGEYRRVDGRVVNFRPVWKQVDGNGWLFGNWNGASWMMCDDEAKLGGVGLADMQTSEPNEPGLWKHRNSNGGWATDSIGWIRVSTDRKTLDGLLANYGY